MVRTIGKIRGLDAWILEVRRYLLKANGHRFLFPECRRDSSYLADPRDNIWI